MASKNVRKCIVAFCTSTTGLHRFPEDLDTKRKWVRALRLSDGDVPPGSGVCNRHFTRDAFSNFTQFDMGFIKTLYLKSNAVPILQPQQGIILLLPNPKRDIGCQTDPVPTKCASVQADLKTPKRSIAVQARAPCRTVCCYTETFSELSVPEDPVPPVKKARRQRGGASADESSSPPDENEPTGKPEARLISSFSDVAPWAQDHNSYVVEEEQLLELFSSCPVCKQSCCVQKTTAGAVVHVHRQCEHCLFTSEWCSQPAASSGPEGGAPISGPTHPQLPEEQQT